MTYSHPGFHLGLHVRSASHCPDDIGQEEWDELVDEMVALLTASDHESRSSSARTASSGSTKASCRRLSRGSRRTCRSASGSFRRSAVPGSSRACTKHGSAANSADRVAGVPGGVLAAPYRPVAG